MDGSNNYSWLKMYSMSRFLFAQPSETDHINVLKKRIRKVKLALGNFFLVLFADWSLGFIFSVQSFIHFLNLSEVSKYFGATVYLCNVLFSDDHSEVCDDDRWFCWKEVFVVMVQYHKSTYLSQKHSSPYKHLSVHDCLKISWFFHCVHCCQTWSVIKHSTESVRHSLVDIEK